MMIDDVMRSDFLDVLPGLLLPLLHFLLLLGQDDPIVLVVVLVAIPLEQVLKHALHRAVLRPFVEAEVPALAEVLGELNWVALAEHLDGGGQLLLLDALVLVALVVGLETLPGEHSPEEVHDHVANALHVVSAGYII